MIFKTPVDYTGTGSKVALSTILGVTKCKWFQAIGITIASIPARLGDSAIDTSGGGFPIGLSGSGSGQFSPPIALAMEFYDLTNIWIIVAVSDVVEIGCAL